MSAAVSVKDLCSTLEQEFALAPAQPRPRVEIYAATPALGAAITAHLCTEHSGPIIHVVADADQLDARRSALEFFLGGRDKSDDPLAPPPVMRSEERRVGKECR